MKLNEFIAGRRKQLSLTLNDIAEKVGVSTGTVAKWESGFITNMRRDKIQALAKILQCSPLVLMSNEIDDSVLNGNPTFINTNIKTPEHHDIQDALAKFIDRLDPSTGLAFFNGETEMDQETRELILMSLKNTLALSQKLSQNKEKQNED